MHTFFGKRSLIYLACICVPGFVQAQNTMERDSLEPKLLDSVTVRLFQTNRQPSSVIHFGVKCYL